MQNIKIAYIGGGSKMWARIFMNDLALNKDFCGEISLYDIDEIASTRNQIIGNMISELPNCVSPWHYTIASTLDKCLKDAQFVVLSILPGTFEEMMVDVHEPEQYGIYQTVGDTVGPGGVLRSMRTVPLYEEFANAIAKICLKAWVINFTNPMSICVKTLYDVFPKIKAFGCCHEVFHAQEFLAMVVKEEKNLLNRPLREEIKIDVVGINHFTWITHASYKGEEILPLIDNYYNKHFIDGVYEGEDPLAFKYNTYAYGNKVKMDIYKRYRVLGAAGDRHLVEFMNNKWYLSSLETINKWAISITPVLSRINDQTSKIEETIKMVNKEKVVEIHKSNEEAVEIMKALLGLGDLITNVNYPNQHQAIGLPDDVIVETNCIFKKDQIEPLIASPLPSGPLNLVVRNCLNINNCYEGIKKRDFNIIFEAFLNQPLCSTLELVEAKQLFKTMVIKTRKYLDPYYDIDNFIKTF